MCSWCWAGIAPRGAIEQSRYHICPPQRPASANCVPKGATPLGPGRGLRNRGSCARRSSFARPSHGIGPPLPARAGRTRRFCQPRHPDVLKYSFPSNPPFLPRSQKSFDQRPKMCAGLGARVQLTGRPPPRPTNRWLRQPTTDDMATTLAMHIDLERPCRQAFYPNLPQTRGVLLYDWLKRTVNRGSWRLRNVVCNSMS